MNQDFTPYNGDVYHCNRCHRVVRTYDAQCDAEVQAMLDAHLAFNCAAPVVAPTDP